LRRVVLRSGRIDKNNRKQPGMSNRLFRLDSTCLLAACLLLAQTVAHAQGPPPGAAADYQARLAQYQSARGAYEAEAMAYWDAIS
jgi:hypothetical protein